MSAQERIKEQIELNPVMLYMKGTPQFPQCGFSGRTVQILQACGAKFASVDVLSDPEIREGIKVFSNWPTIPQLYINGEFIGGCDIVTDLFEKGELQKMLGSV
ncbi:MAG: Grx4 family monothiol glutaredoxin [Gammaproteobacteria bacterium]|nr:Grx4 family monothiol glutaredoxin [Gammaproteobacteria bacterium]